MFVAGGQRDEMDIITHGGPLLLSAVAHQRYVSTGSNNYIG